VLQRLSVKAATAKELAFIPCTFLASTLHHIHHKSRMYN
jgi:hypothetical protein